MIENSSPSKKAHAISLQFIAIKTNQMDKLLHTSLYRAILKSLNRKATSEKRLQTYFFEFANEITIICNNTEYLSVCIH